MLESPDHRVGGLKKRAGSAARRTGMEAHSNLTPERESPFVQTGNTGGGMMQGTAVKRSVKPSSVVLVAVPLV